MNLNDYLDHHLYDPDTGETLEISLRDFYAEAVRTGERRAAMKKTSIKKFALIQTPVLAVIARELTGEQLRVLLTLLEDLQEGLRIISPTGDLARRLDVRTNAVSRSLARLIELGIIERESQGVYSLNPWLGYQGMLADWKVRLLHAQMPAPLAAAEAEEEEPDDQREELAEPVL